ncbi:MAG: hypothetical protein H6669_13600 [Ardenticatenaceae bacterium]|nr:hypothetical protein [Ardenticatenaceae bacterium]
MFTVITWLPFLATSITVVAKDLQPASDIDGIHLDNIRYGASNASYDPVSSLITTPTTLMLMAAAAGKRHGAQVSRVPYLEVRIGSAASGRSTRKSRNGLTEYYQQGYSTYYQDSKAWIADGYIDSISPMIYPGGIVNCPDDNDYWTQERWGILVADYQADSNGRYIIPGIGADYCSFDEIEARINIARQIGTAGHAIFSYRGLLASGYFDDLANGSMPRRQCPTLPGIRNCSDLRGWRPKSPTS